MTPMPQMTGVIDAAVINSFEDTVDGDTVDLTFSYPIGNHEVMIKIRCRLFGIDAYEMKNKPLGPLAKAFTRQWIDDGWMKVKEPDDRPFRVQLVPRNPRQDNPKDHLDRYLARVWRKLDGECLNDALVGTGHAVYKEYD